MRLFALLTTFAILLPAQSRQLFNGKDFAGWAWVDNEGFRIEDGSIRTQGNKGMLWYTREKLGNVVLRVVYKMSNPKGNSGIFIRIPDQPPTERYAIHNGIEVQIDDNDDDWHSTGVLYSMTKAKARPSKPAGEWNQLDITLDGLRTVVHLNGVLVTDYDGVSAVPERTKPYEPERKPRPEFGYIGIQNHDERAALHFKEISARPLPAASAGISGAFTGDWTSSVSGVGGTFRMAIARGAGGQPQAEVTFTIGEAEVKTKVVFLKIEGSKIEVKYQYDLGDSRLESHIVGELSGETLAGKYRAANVPEGSQVDEGSWKAAPLK